MTSSPDPLGSLDEEATLSTISPRKLRAASITPRKPLTDVSGNSAVQEFYISTPTPPKRRTSPVKGKGSSPWRIRVTLEAEPSDEPLEDEGLREETMVTKIPLKGADDSSSMDADKGRGRPRKSLGSPIKRPATPKFSTRRRKTVSTSAEVEENIDQREMSPFAKRGDAFPKRRRRKSRSPNKQNNQAVSEPTTERMSENDPAAQSKRKRSRSRKRRAEITPMKLFQDLDDTVLADPKSPIEMPNDHVQEQAPDGGEKADPDNYAKALDDDEKPRKYDTPYFLAEGTPQKPAEEGREATPDPFDGHREFDTILESEGFSMVSVESLSSAGKYLVSPAEPTGEMAPDVTTRSENQALKDSSLREASVYGYSDISSFIPAIASPTKTSHLPVEIVHGYSDISSFIPAVASPTKTSHLPEEIVHGYSDISSFIPAIASPTKTSHLPAPDKTETPEHDSSIIRSADSCANISSTEAGVPISNRIAQLRPKPQGRASTSPARSQNAHRFSDTSSILSDEPLYLSGTRQVLLRINTTPIRTSSPSMPAGPVAVQDSSSSRPVNQMSDGIPPLYRAKRAGNALQDLQSPKERVIQYSDRLGSPFQVYNKSSQSVAGDNSVAKEEDGSRAKRKSSPVVNVERISNNFGAATRRELKAGNWLGEELAKRETQKASASHSKHRVEQSQIIPDQAANSSTQATSSAPGRGLLHYPKLSPRELPSPAESIMNEEEHDVSQKSYMQKQHSELVLPLDPRRRIRTISPDPEASPVRDTIQAREAEWQREREAVSRKIQMANASQVIVIDSDDSLQSQDSEDETDVFAGVRRDLGSPEIKVEAESTTSDLFLQPEVSRPRRSELPRSWRRSSQVYNAGQTSGSVESDLFWQPGKTKATNRRHQRKRHQKEDQVEASTLHDDRVSRLEEGQSIRVPSSTLLAVSKATEPVPAHDSEPQRTDLTIRKTFENLKVLESSGESESQYESNVFEYEESEELEETPNSYRSDDVTQDNLKPRKHPHVDEPSIASSTDVTGTPDAWSSQGLTFLDPELLPIPNETTTSKSQDIAIQTSFISSPTPQITSTDPKPPAATSAPLPSTTWLSTLSSLFTQPPSPIPWYNSPTSNLPPATRSDILASSPYTALSPTTPWTKAHQVALIPLYQSSWLFGAHIFAASHPSSPAARHISHTFTTPLGWSRKITPQDASVVDAFMILLAARSKLYHPSQLSAATTDHHNHNQYNVPPGTPITEDLVLQKCIEIWQDMIMCGDVDPQPGETVGLRRKGDRVWRVGSWWDVERERSQMGYYERKRRGWGGLPSWRVKGLI